MLNLLIYYRIYIGRKNDLHHLKSILLYYNKNKHKIIYIINPTAGLANTIRGITSTIYLSFFFKYSFFLKGWDSITFYFNFPDKMILLQKNISEGKRYFLFKNTIINDMERKIEYISITDIHGFTNKLLKIFNNKKEILSLKMLYSLKEITARIMNSIIYNELFDPSKMINTYINLFNKKKRNRKVLGIHIRTGLFNNNFTEKYFSHKIDFDKLYRTSYIIISRYNISYVFVISDNKKYLQKMKLYFNNYIIDIAIEGDIVHSRFSLYNPDMNKNAIKIVSDFFLLSNCDVIIGTKRSSFTYEACNRLLKTCYTI